MIYPTESQVNIEYRSNSLIVFKGNIFTQRKKSHIKRIILKINHMEYPAFCRLDHTEAPTAISYPWKWLSSFECKISASELGEGYHSLSVKIQTEEKENYLMLRKIVILNLHKHLYQLWIKRNEPGEDEFALQRKRNFIHEPKISILLESKTISPHHLNKMIESIVNQIYPNWELCIMDQENIWEPVLKGLEIFADQKKIKFINKKQLLEESSRLISFTTGDFISFLNETIVLAPFALFEIVRTINENPSVEFLYSDEDKIIFTGTGEERYDPYFKPGWAVDTLRSYNYIGHFFIVKKELGDKIDWFKKGIDGYDYHVFFLKISENTKNVFHISKILFHQVQDKKQVQPNADLKNKTSLDNEVDALNAHFSKSGTNAIAQCGILPNTYQVRYPLKTKHMISIIIPNKDSPGDLDKCLHSILNRSSFKNYEIIVVDNGSERKETFSLYNRIKENKKIKLIKWEKQFNYAAVNNYAVNYSQGDILLFLNNDTEVINPDWLERMLEHAVREEVGAVGAKLYYPDNAIQHAGVVIGLFGIAGHVYRYSPADSPGYFGRLKIIQNVSAVSGACLMTRKNVFEIVSGFDERFAIDFNDIDLCLKIRERGFVIVWTPFTELYHTEMKTRGFHDTLEKRKKFIKAIDLFQKKWRYFLKEGDPYYNPNLTLEREDFTLKLFSS
jgi:GT2 family glycosyltransferase